MYSVTVYFRDDGLNKLGTTRVEAENEEEARNKAKDELFDPRLDAPAFFEVEEARLDRSCAVQLDSECPECGNEGAFGYTYEKQDPTTENVVVLQCMDCEHEWQKEGQA